MAITLDELLGRNTTNNTETIERFPSYEDFRSSRSNGTQSTTRGDDRARYNFDMRPAQAPRTEDSVRSYEASRPYVAPQVTEYQTRDYAFYDTLRASRTAQRNDVDNEYGYANYEKYAKPSYKTPEKIQNLYEFTAKDNDRLSDAELLNKLSHTDESRRPIFDRANNATVATQQSGIISRKVEKTEEKSVEKKRARLNTKGKIILGVYLAVIVLVAVLIIVNANKINNGTSTTPSANFMNEASVAYADSVNISEAMQIDSRYEVRI